MVGSEFFVMLEKFGPQDPTYSKQTIFMSQYKEESLALKLPITQVHKLMEMVDSSCGKKNSVRLSCPL